MIFKTLGDPQAPAVLFFHAMGVTGGSSEPVAQHLQDKYFSASSPPPPSTAPAKNTKAKPTKCGRWRTFSAARG